MKKLLFIIGAATLLSACSSSNHLSLTHSRYGNGWGLSMGEGGLNKGEEAKAEAFRNEMHEKLAFKNTLRDMQASKRGLQVLNIEDDIIADRAAFNDETVVEAKTNNAKIEATAVQSNAKDIAIAPEVTKVTAVKKNAVKGLVQESSKKPMSSSDVALLLLIIIALLLPPLAVFLHEGELNVRFWICLLLTIFGFWIIGVIYALIVILGNH